MSEYPKCSLDVCIDTTSTGNGVIIRNKSGLCYYIAFTSYVNDKETTVDIFKDGVYDITYYSSEDNAMVSLKDVTITSIGPESIMGKYIEYNCPVDTPCGVNLMSRADIKVVCIPLSNISKIKDVTCKPKPDIKEVSKVSILGISTEFIHSVIVRLYIYDDNIKTDVIPVDMEVGNTYNVSYMDQMDKTMYEIEGKLVSICIDRHFGDEPPQTGFVRPECPNPEVVGMGNSIYYDQNHFMELPKDCPEKVVFIFDTSKTSHSIHDHVRLTDIRNVKLISTKEDDTTDEETPSDPECPVIGEMQINEFTKVIFNNDGYVIQDMEGNELEKISRIDLIKDYTSDKY